MVKTIKWRPTLRTGMLADARFVILPQAEFDECEQIYRDRGADAMLEIRTRFDLWSWFPGTTEGEEHG